MRIYSANKPRLRPLICPLTPPPPSLRPSPRTHSLFNGERRVKTDEAFEALGSVDEVNSALGLAMSYCEVRGEAAVPTPIFRTNVSFHSFSRLFFLYLSHPLRTSRPPWVPGSWSSSVRCSRGCSMWGPPWPPLSPRPPRAKCSARACSRTRTRSSLSSGSTRWTRSLCRSRSSSCPRAARRRRTSTWRGPRAAGRRER
jgi:hypothetical protein